MMTFHRSRKLRSSFRRGFTLVEMMVAVALVLLMMTMFAEIFTLATGSMGKQKALAELDQRQRMFSTVIRSDIQGKTFSSIVAFHPAAFGTVSNGQGYFYISENDPDDDSDDVLQFTVRRPADSGDPFYGRAKELLDSAGNGINPALPDSPNPNQPENDDGNISNQVGSSELGEVSYFMRNGILYRRVFLVRNAVRDRPEDAAANALIQSGVYPQGSMSGQIYVRSGSTANRFPLDFDYSATYDYTASRVEFLGRQSLDNNKGPADSLILGIPSRRFGFTPTPNPGASRPFEYLASGQFIGRFTHEETSHPDFAFPGNPGLGPDGIYGNGDDTNPYTRTGLALSPSGAVSPYNIPIATTRQGEDILLTNVYSFDVKVWDHIMNDFVDIGHNGMNFVTGVATPQNGEYSQARNQNPNYGPNPAGNNRCFDTWHTNMDTIGAPPYVISNPPPFRPVVSLGLGNFPGVAGDGIPGGVGDDDQNGIDDNPEEAGWPGSDDTILPMRAIKIRVRYRDKSSGLTREVSIIESLLPQ